MMINLTKEKCVACLNYEKNMSPTVKKCFKMLIDEHFDNPPLEFEDLCEDEPVFDKVSNCWRYVLQKDYDKEGFYDSINDEWVNFKNNSFYAKEVKDDE